MGEPTNDIPPASKPLNGHSECRLDSWKEIAVYLNRDLTTVQRWEKQEAMPVHRHRHNKRGSVYALPEELDSWIRSRRRRLDEPDFRPATPTTQPLPARVRSPRNGLWLAASSRAVSLCVGCLACSSEPRIHSGSARNSFSGGAAPSQPFRRPRARLPG